jgi:hypothetical protein
MFYLNRGRNGVKVKLDSHSGTPIDWKRCPRIAFINGLPQNCSACTAITEHIKLSAAWSRLTLMLKLQARYLKA